MAIEAIGSIGQNASAVKSTEMGQAMNSAQTTQSTPPVEAQNVVSQHVDGVSEVGSGGFAHNLASEVYAGMDKVGAELSPIKGSENSQVDQAKKALLPDNDALSPVKSAAKSTGNEALMSLNKTFDHAVFMAMLNQVVSGVSDTSRTLIKQQ